MRRGPAFETLLRSGSFFPFGEAPEQLAAYDHRQRARQASNAARNAR
jgi:hypothetical protein